MYYPELEAITFHDEDDPKYALKISDFETINISVNDLFLEDNEPMNWIDGCFTRDKFDYYSYYGLPVPRVTEIIDQQYYNESLNQWKIMTTPKDYKRIRENSQKIGSITHQMIENYLINQTDLPIPFTIRYDQEKEIKTAYENFKRWKFTLEQINGYKIERILVIEQKLVCPYFGGTLDLLATINGRNYIIDFKTSKKISPPYIIQLGSYFWLLNNGYFENPALKDVSADGIGVVRLDKQKLDKFEDFFLDYGIEDHKYMIKNSIYSFFSMLNAFYYNLNLQNFFDSMKLERNKKCSLEDIFDD